MNLPEAQKFGVLEPGNLPQDALLLGKLEVVLETHQIIAGEAQVFRPELHHGEGLPAGSRVRQAHGLHGAEAKRVVPSPRQFFDGQAGFEVIQVFEFMRWRPSPRRAVLHRRRDIRLPSSGQFR